MTDDLAAFLDAAEARMTEPAAVKFIEGVRSDVPVLVGMVRAVLARHHPETNALAGQPWCYECSTPARALLGKTDWSAMVRGDQDIPWPCATVAALLSAIPPLPGHQEGPLTVAALLDFCVQERLHPDEVTVTGGHLQWTTAETDEERRAREAAQTASEERTNEWERKNLVRLIEKHGLPEAFTTSCACGHPEKTNLDHSFTVCHQHGVPPGEGTFTR